MLGAIRGREVREAGVMSYPSVSLCDERTKSLGRPYTWANDLAISKTIMSCYWKNDCGPTFFILLGQCNSVVGHAHVLVSGSGKWNNLKLKFWAFKFFKVVRLHLCGVFIRLLNNVCGSHVFILYVVSNLLWPLHYIMHWGAKMKPSLLTGCTETKWRLNGKRL